MIKIVPNQEHEREREIKHIATSTNPQPWGWTNPSSSWWMPGWWRWHPMMISPSIRVPKQGLVWFFVATEACGGGTPDLLCSSMFLGYMDIYRRKKSVRGATRGPGGWGGVPRGVGRASLPRGHLEASLTSTPSLLDCFRSKNNSPKGFIPFGLRLIFLFFETLK